MNLISILNPINNTFKRTTVTNTTINTSTDIREIKQENNDTQIPKVPSSSFSGCGMSKPNDDNLVSSHTCSQKSINGSQKRQADRASRNRESRLHQCEKAKTKV